MSIIEPGDTMTNPNGVEHKVLEVSGASVMEVEDNETGHRLLLGYWDSGWRWASDNWPWTHTPARPTVTTKSRPTITAKNRGIYADGKIGRLAGVYWDSEWPEGWDINKVAASIAKHLNEVDLDELTATETTP